MTLPTTRAVGTVFVEGERVVIGSGCEIALVADAPDRLVVVVEALVQTFEETMGGGRRGRLTPVAVTLRTKMSWRSTSMGRWRRRRSNRRPAVRPAVWPAGQ